MKLFLIIVTLKLALGASIVDVTCPDSCTCQTKNDNLEIECSSYEFIKKLIPKQVSTIVRLNINNVSLNTIDTKLKYLKNLNHLDLSHNQIVDLPSQFPYLPKLKELNLSHNRLSTVSLSQLPKNLHVIDLSHNSIKHFPKDWSNLKLLTQIKFHDNPIDCDCNNILTYEKLLEAGIILDNLTCHEQALNPANCSLLQENLLNSMLGDEAGSGFSEDAELTNEFINAEEEPATPAHEDLLVVGEEEGSGEEGSGYEIPILPIPACKFNCSTPTPIGLTDEKDAAPPPDLKDQVGIIFDDIFGSGEDSTTPTTTTTTTTTTTSTSEAAPAVVEEPHGKVLIKDLQEEVETFPTNNTVVTGEMERASTYGPSTESVYIIIGLIIAFTTFLIIYLVQKRKNRARSNSRKRNRPNENGVGEEMKPLGKKPAVEPQIHMNNSSKIPPNNEGVPLLKGQNGKVSDDIKARPHVVDDDGLEEVEIRNKPDHLLLTPQPERVTIKAGELPDSIPKTPLLVHRQLNSDGEIITTAVNSN